MLINKLTLVFVSGLLLTLVSTVTFTIDVLRFPYDEAELHSGVIDMECDRESSLILPDLKLGDKVFVSLHTTASVDLMISSGSSIIPSAPFEIEGRSYDFVDYLIVTKRYLFVAEEAGDYTLHFTPLTPKTPYGLVTIGNLNVRICQTIFDGYEMLNVTLSSFRNTGERFPRIFLVYPVDVTVKEDFAVGGIVGLSKVGVGMVNINIIDETDNALYSYSILPFFAREGDLKFFEVNVASEELMYFGNLDGDHISFVCISISLDKLHFAFQNEDIVYASVLLGDLNISNGDELVKVDAEAHNVFSVPYEAYIFTKYRPSYYVYVSQSFIVIGLIMIGAGVFARGKKQR